MSVVTLTMAITPLLSTLTEKLIAKLDFNFSNPIQQVQLGSRDIGNHVVIGGFGTVGKTVANVLEDQDINYIAIELDQNIVKSHFEKNPVYRGDISQLDLLKAAGIERAIAFIITIDNHITTKKTVKLVHQNFPHIPIIVRTNSVRYIEDLLLSGASIVVPEDCETALQLGGAVLQSFGVGDVEVARIKTHIRSFNYDVTQYSTKSKSQDEIFDLDKDIV